MSLLLRGWGRVVAYRWPDVDWVLNGICTTYIVYKAMECSGMHMNVVPL